MGGRVDAFIAAQPREEARDAAQRAIEDVVARSDVDVAGRWLGALAGQGVAPSAAFVEAELRLALAAEDYGRGADTCDRLLSTAGGAGDLFRGLDRVAATRLSFLSPSRP